MKKLTKVLMAASALAGAALQWPGVSDAISALVMAHPKSVLSAVALLLIGALKHDPQKKQDQQQ